MTTPMLLCALAVWAAVTIPLVLGVCWLLRRRTPEYARLPEDWRWGVALRTCSRNSERETDGEL